MNAQLEFVTKAVHSIDFAIDDLIALLNISDPVLSLVVLQLNEQANSFRDRLKQVEIALKADSLHKDGI